MMSLILWDNIGHQNKYCTETSLLPPEDSESKDLTRHMSEDFNKKSDQKKLETVLTIADENSNYCDSQALLDKIELTKASGVKSSQVDSKSNTDVMRNKDTHAVIESCSHLNVTHKTNEKADEACAKPKSSHTVTFNLGANDEEDDDDNEETESTEINSNPKGNLKAPRRLSLLASAARKYNRKQTDRPTTSLKQHLKVKMSMHHRSNSHPEQLHLIIDDVNEQKFHEKFDTSNQPNGRIHKGKPPHSLPQSLEDMSADNLIDGRCLESSDEEYDKHSQQHPVMDAEETLWSHRPSEFRLRDQLFSFFQASDNKLAMKLFGSRNALLKEKQRQMAAKSWIIHPCSNFRLYWDLLMLIFLVTNLVVLPVSIAFFYHDVGVHWIVFNITCDTMFILDIIINFRTGLIDNESHGNVILDPKVIALRYLKSWFIIDFVSSLPLDYVFLGIEGQSYSAGRALRILRLAKLLQLLRLLRISRLVRYVRLWQEFFSLASIVVKLFNLICIMVLMGHWSGCIQFFVPVIQGLPEDSWIVIDKIQNAHWWEQYTRALFKALSHMLCIGYGQYPPRNMTDTWLTIGSMLAGATCYALFIGHATTLIQSFDTSSRQFRDHLQQVNEYMIYRKLPTDLRRRITDYYDHRFGGKMFNEAAILSEISASLRKDVIYHNCRELIRNVPFFVNADNSFVMDVITKLEFEMYQPGDIVIKAATKGDRMFFIQEGLIEILTQEGKIVTRLGDGSYFGEISLLTQQNRVATVKAAAYSNLFSLSKENFDRILENYPLMRRTLETIAAKRLHTLGIDPSLVTSRESLLDDINGIQKVFQRSRGEDDSSDDDTGTTNSISTSKESNSQFLTVVKSFFTKDSEDFSPTTRHSRTTPNHDHNLPRCKSTLNHLILVPQVAQGAQGFTRRVKSTADVPSYEAGSQDFKTGQFYNEGMPAFDNRVLSNTSLSSKNTSETSKWVRTGSPIPSCRFEKASFVTKRKFSSQPASPQLSPVNRPVFQEEIPCTKPNIYNTKPPEVRVIPQSDSSLNLSDDDEEDTVRFTIDDDSPI